jgi:hypothetical protein
MFRQKGRSETKPATSDHDIFHLSTAITSSIEGLLKKTIHIKFPSMIHRFISFTYLLFQWPLRCTSIGSSSGAAFVSSKAGSRGLIALPPTCHMAGGFE